MQAAIEIPTPNASDSDTVATALETAAIFSARGDTAEAIRWVQRAAEHAGEAGDDLRTLTLARTAADLTRSLQSESAPPAPSLAAPSEGAVRRLPKPPLRQSSNFPAADPQPVDEDESRVTLSRRAEPSRTPAPSAVQPTSTRPPPPSHRPLFSAPTRPSGNAGASGVAGTASVASRPPVVSSVKPVASSLDRRRPAVSTPAPASVAPRSESVTPRSESAAPRSESVTPRSESVAPRKESLSARAEVERRENASPGSSATSLADVTSSAPEVAADAPAAPSILKPVESEPVAKRAPSTVRPADPAQAGTRLRAAARVSVVASSTEPGLYFVRLLEDGQPAPSSATEALMVLLDPSSTLFSG